MSANEKSENEISVMGFDFVTLLPADVDLSFELVYRRIDKSNEIMLMSIIRKMVSNSTCKYIKAELG